MWKKLMKLVDLGEPTSSLDHIFLQRTQRECKSDEGIIEEYKRSSIHESLLGQLKSYLLGRSLTRKQ